MGEKNDLDSRVLRETFRKFDDALRCFCRMVLVEFTAQDVNVVVLHQLTV